MTIAILVLITVTAILAGALAWTVRALVRTRRDLAVAKHLLMLEARRAFTENARRVLSPLFREGIAAPDEPDYDAGAIPPFALRKPEKGQGK